MISASSTRPVDNVLQRIPPFPTALVSILHSCSASDPSVADIAQAVSMEEVLAAKVVRAANAAALAPVHPVDNVADAVSRLGASAIRGMASAYFLGNVFSGAFSQSGLDREALWRHNLAVAAASAGAAGPGTERANAYFAGLMHDVGKMILASEIGQVYSDCIAESLATGKDLYLVERSRLGTDHAEIGADAAEQWHFAPDLVEAIRRHHQILGAGLLQPLASHVLVGNQVANDMGIALITQAHADATMTLTTMTTSIGAGIMSRARWALTNEMPRIEAMLGSIV
ncbi:MAG: HDOD domain-containing protein [Armatimonadetes bacterium]|nr:HDOD domain-containing protein [Armatimonadota bacterium]